MGGEACALHQLVCTAWEEPCVCTGQEHRLDLAFGRGRMGVMCSFLSWLFVNVYVRHVSGDPRRSVSVQIQGIDGPFCGHESWIWEVVYWRFEMCLNLFVMKVQLQFALMQCSEEKLFNLFTFVWNGRCTCGKAWDVSALVLLVALR